MGNINKFDLLPNSISIRIEEVASLFASEIDAEEAAPHHYEGKYRETLHEIANATELNYMSKQFALEVVEEYFFEVVANLYDSKPNSLELEGSMLQVDYRLPEGKVLLWLSKVFLDPKPVRREIEQAISDWQYEHEQALINHSGCIELLKLRLIYTGQILSMIYWLNKIWKLVSIWTWIS